MVSGQGSEFRLVHHLLDLFTDLCPHPYITGAGVEGDGASLSKRMGVGCWGLPEKVIQKQFTWSP